MKTLHLKGIIGLLLACLLSCFLADITGVSASESVKVLTVSTAKQYALANSELGAEVYIDRTYSLTEISPRLLGGTLVQTANDDKRETADSHLMLQFNQSADVFVCYDKRAQSLPSWLEDGNWRPTDETILSTDAPAGPMRVYSMWVTAGTILTLGGNLATGAIGAQSNYIVIVKSSELPPPIEPVAINFVSSGKEYRLAALNLEGPCYIDRLYTVTQLSPELDGALLIQTANDDKYVAHANHLQLHFNETATVYVCYDRRANTLPDWLSNPGWMPTPESFASTDSRAGPMQVWARSVTAGEDLMLGGNHTGGDTGARSNYLVAVKLLGGESPPPQATFTVEPATVSVGNTAMLEWRTFYAQSCRIEPEIGPVAASGSITITPSETTRYTLVGEGPGGAVQAETEIVVVPNQPPAIELLEPEGSNAIADGAFFIKWLDEDPDSSAAISLYYDRDNEGADGDLIVKGLSEDSDQPAEDSYEWKTTQVPPGSYYVYAIIDDGVNAPIIVYSKKVVNIRHFTPGNKITPLDAETRGFFGCSVALSGDYAIAGAFGSSAYAGAAYIFKQGETGWDQQTKLTPPTSYGEFGISVALDGQFAVVGNPREQSAYRALAGAAYIYKFEGSQWVLDKRIAADLPYTEAKFGGAVAINGALVIVGAQGDSESESGSGAAYVFEKQGSYWWQIVKLMAEDAARGDHFGSSVSIGGDCAIVGANFARQNEDRIGAAYIFKREGETWIQQAKLTAGAKNFAKSVAIDNNYLAIGATDLDSSGLPLGSVYIFKFDGNRWAQAAKLNGSETVPYENFGCSVSIQGDYVAVGSKRTHEDGIIRGATYLFKRIGSDWVELTKHAARGAETHDYFGSSVSVDDGRLLVGAYGDQEDVFYSGAAYIFPYLSSGIEANPPAIARGESTTLSWHTRYADTCSIEPGIGSVALEGSVDLEPVETTTFILTAAGAEGTDTAMVTVTVSDPPTASLADYIKVVSSTEAGITPLEITLTIDGSFTFSLPSVYYSGPDQVAFLDSTNDNEFNIRLSTPGTYLFVVEAVDDQGNVYTDKVAVAAFEGADIDKLLKARWADMKTALANRDIAKALENFVPESQALYGDIFTVFYDDLPQIVIDMEEIQIINLIDKSAKYRIRKDEFYGGAMESITYYIYFTLDDDGLWKIYRF